MPFKHYAFKVICWVVNNLVTNSGDSHVVWYNKFNVLATWKNKFIS